MLGEEYVSALLLLSFRDDGEKDGGKKTDSLRTDDKVPSKEERRTKQ